MLTRMRISTGARVELQEITAQVKQVVRESGVKDGVCYLFVPHTTAGLVVNEHADPSVVRDIISQLETLVPSQAKYLHLEGNAPAHVKSSIVGCSLTLFVEEGSLVVGTWQGIFFAEFDGPRQRTLLVKVMPG
ncbi:MAG: secondary thiamine-phosphate synthase enzyme YjbQ [Chloroflexota bacterium]